MKKILSVIKREYLQIVRTKGFIISTILGPVLIAALVIIPTIMAVASVGEKKHLAAVDLSRQVFQELDNKLKDYKMKDGSRRYSLQEFKPAANIEELRNTLSRQVLAKKFSAYVFIPENILSGGVAEYASQHVSDFDEIKRINEALNSVVVEKRLRKEGLEPRKIAEFIKHVSLKTVKVTEKGEEEEMGGTFAIAYLLPLILYMTLFFYGSIILRGVIEEKNNRVVEVVLSSLTPFQLMLGKILGIAAVGFTQYGLWALFGLAASRYGGSLVTSLFPAAAVFKMASLPAYIFIYFVVFFILGYFLYGTLYAAVGSMVNSEKEAQQLLMPITMLLVIPMLMMMAVLRSPNGSLSVILSLIPFTSPILMLMRVCVLFPPPGQLALSIVFLVLTILFMIWLTAKIYRVGILMYGKKPSMSEIIKWIRYK